MKNYTSNIYLTNLKKTMFYILLFNTTTETIVIQKKTPGQAEVSVIAKITVHTNIKTCTKMPHTIRVVKLPLKVQYTL